MKSVDQIEENSEVKLRKAFYPLSSIIKDTISKHVNSIKCILDDDPKSRDYMLKELLSSYNTGWINEKINKWVFDNYSKNIATEDYNDLLRVTTVLTGLVVGASHLIDKETTFFKKKYEYIPYEECRKIVHGAVVHEFIVSSSLTSDEVTSLGEVYEQFL